MICAKIYRTSPQESDALPSVKDFNLKWSQTGDVYYQEIIPKGKAKLDVLFLHGHSFSSKNWLEINTLNILASHGYRVIALDLPGYGKSSYKLDTTDATSRSDFLYHFIQKTRIESPVIVSPSMSGVYSLAYIAAHRAVKGFVAIAVVGTDKVSHSDYAHFPPSLIVRGSRDKRLGIVSTDTLGKYIPDNSAKVIGDAGHACYLNKPQEFHDMLLKFLEYVIKR